MKTVAIDLKKLIDAVDNEVDRNIKFNTLQTKVNNLEIKIPDAATLIQITHYINIRTVMKNPEMLKFVPDHLKTKKMCKYVVKKIPYLLRYVPNQY